MRKIIVSLWLVLLFLITGALFWYNDWVYKLPTPVPENYRPVEQGKFISLKAPLSNYKNRPLFLHFFNPDCPCSRFNMETFKKIQQQYGTQVNFAIVVLSKKKYAVKDIQDKFGLTIPVLFDSSIATTCGVYSTPQAVLLDNEHKLYYRGNYNTSRYCTNEKTSFAKIALAGLIRNQTKLAFTQAALKAYGCQLPGCTK